MSALAEALLAAQRQAVAALAKSFLAGPGGEDAREALHEALDLIGCTDKVEQRYLGLALEYLHEFGVSAPIANGAAAKPATENEPASDAQWTLLRKLADEKGKVAPAGPLTKAQASAAINALKAGIYNADAYSVPF